MPSSGPAAAWPATLLGLMFRCAGQTGCGTLMSNDRPANQMPRKTSTEIEAPLDGGCACRTVRYRMHDLLSTRSGEATQRALLAFAGLRFVVRDSLFDAVVAFEAEILSIMLAHRAGRRLRVVANASHGPRAEVEPARLPDRTRTGARNERWR